MPKIPATKIIRASTAPKEDKKKPATEAEYIAEEAGEELPPKRMADPISEAVGRIFHVAPLHRDGWQDKQQRQFRVTRLYPGVPEVIIDKPSSEAELKMKEAFFAASPIAYVAVKPLEAIDVKTLRARMRAVVASTLKQMKAA